MTYRKDFSRLRKTGNHFNLGIIISVGLALMAFNYSSPKKAFFPEDQVGLVQEVDDDVPITRWEKPQPPPPAVFKNPVIIEPLVDFVEPVKSEPVNLLKPEPILIAKDIKVVIKKKAIAPVPIKIEIVEKEDDENEIVVFAQQMPRFNSKKCELIDDEAELKKCAEQELLLFMHNKLRYPSIARENTAQGIAVIQFIVDKKGRIIDPKIVKDPGAGLGAEALRVVKLMDNWVPGEQNFRPVKVLFNLPVKFVLNE